MKLAYNLAENTKNSVIRIGKRNAYHLAGRIAAIHFGNQQKNLPSVHFQVAVNSYERESGYERLSRIPRKVLATLEGGRLIAHLPHCYQSATRLLSDAEKHQCQAAFEADVINILAGPLAEAKYVALRDGEVFNANLIYLGALKFYSGAMDLLAVDEYMDCLFPDHGTERQQKMASLFLAAYGFISKPEIWQATTRLAEGLCNDPKDTVSCDELIAMFAPKAPQYPKTQPLLSIKPSFEIRV